MSASVTAVVYSLHHATISNVSNSPAIFASVGYAPLAVASHPQEYSPDAIVASSSMPSPFSPRAFLAVTVSESVFDTADTDGCMVVANA